MMSMKFDGSWNYDHLAVPDLMHQQAIAYVDCAIELCKRMKQEELDCNFLRGQATLYLGFHSTELFFKAAILHKSQELITHHNLRELRERYEELFPEELFQITTHYQTHYMDYTEQEVAEFIKREKPKDQKYRYPVDKHKNKWWIREAFDVVTCLDQFRQYREALERVGLKIYSLPGQTCTMDIESASPDREKRK